MHYIVMLFFFFFFVINEQAYGMENSPQCTLAHAPNNPDLIVLCEPKALYFYNPTTSSCTTKKKGRDTYHSIAANNDIIAIQTKNGLELHYQDHAQKIRKTWHPNLGTTCRNQIALFPNDNDTLVVHNIDENETTITHSVEIHSINSSHKKISFCQTFDKAKNSINLKPLIACHPYKNQVAFKLNNYTLALHNIVLPDLRDLLIMHLLHCNNNTEKTIFNELPEEIRNLISTNLAHSLGIKRITQKIKRSRLTHSYDLIEYSPDGISIMLLFQGEFNNNYLWTYHTIEKSRKTQSHPFSTPIASFAFYPNTKQTLARLFQDGSICCDNEEHFSETIKLNCNESIPSGVTKKIMAFSGDGKILYIAKENELIKYTISEETVEKIKQLSL